MKYLVMECHPGYAVVLDENGKCSKVANMRYEVGQTVTDVIELSTPEAAPKRRINIKTLSSLAAVACLILVFIPLLILRGNPYASVYMKINPEVRIDVDKQETVVGLTAVNEDGNILIKGYEFKNKNLDTVVNELVDKAIEMEYLKEGGTVSVTLEADDDIWMQSKSETMNTELTDHITKKIPANVKIDHRHRHDDDDDDDDDKYEKDDDGIDDDDDDDDHDDGHDDDDDHDDDHDDDDIGEDDHEEEEEDDIDDD